VRAERALTAAAGAEVSEARPRLHHLDNIRSLVIFLVVVMHSNVTYSGMGSWYYVEGSPSRLDIVSASIFGFYGTFVQAWSMGILFFLGGHFAARGLARRGRRCFLRERLFRLGLPLLLYVLVIEPLLDYLFGNAGRNLRTTSLPRLWWWYLSSGAFVKGTGPLWFVEALLIFCGLYALLRAAVPRAAPEGPMPATGTLLALTGLTGGVAFAVRIFWPIGTAFGNLQLPFFASYLALFFLGVHAGEAGWLDQIPGRTGLRWFRAALGVGIPAWMVLMVTGGALSGGFPLGGLRWQVLAFALWEAFVAVAMSLGLVAFAWAHLAAENPLTRALAKTSFGIYVFHPPVLVAISLLLAPLALPMLAKHALVAPLAFGASLLVAAAARRVPLLKAVIR
jgi:peptidoglycan/LPS O-acetylase OafA/YrhL